jgi:hypothetical protein
VSVAWTLIGIVLGAVIAGVVNLWLTERAEWRDARAGERELLDALRLARSRIDKHRSREQWWEPAASPSLAAWEQHRASLTAQLTVAQLAAIEPAVHEIQRLNTMAELDAEINAELGTRADRARALVEQSLAQRGVLNPARAVDDDPALQDYLACIGPRATALSGDDKDAMRKALAAIKPAVDELTELSRRRWVDRHRRSVLIGVAFVTLVIAAVIADRLFLWEPPVPDQAVAAALMRSLMRDPEASTSAAHPSVVDCDAMAGSAHVWVCTVGYDLQGCPCPTAETRPLLVAQAGGRPPRPGAPRFAGGASLWRVNQLSERKAAIADEIAETASRVGPAVAKAAVKAGASLISGMVPTAADGDDQTRELYFGN